MHAAALTTPKPRISMRFFLTARPLAFVAQIKRGVTAGRANMRA